MNINDLFSNKTPEQIDKEYKQMLYEKEWYPDEGSVVGPFVPGQGYQPINGLPAGGEAGQCLVKSSDKDYETVWKDFPDLPAYLKEITLERMEEWDNKQELLIPGINIKTINNISLLGKGNLEIIGGDSLPINSIFSYDGETVPEGYEEVLGDDLYEGDPVPVGAIFDYAGTELPQGFEQLPDITPEIYSTEEIVIGYWTNNKPLYRKVLHVSPSVFGTGTATAGTAISFAHGVSNLEFVSRKDLYFRRITTTKMQFRSFPGNYYGATVNWAGQIYLDEDNVYVEVGYSMLNALSSAQCDYIAIILEYTKIEE